MRSLLVLCLAAGLAVGNQRAARADGPDEPKPTTSSEPAPAPVTVAPAPAAAAPVLAPRETEEILPNPSKKWAWGFGGAAVGTWILFAGLGGAAKGISNAQEGNPSSPMVYRQSDADQAQLGKDLATAGYVFMGLASALTIIDAVIWFECLRKPRVIKKMVASMFSPAGVRF